MTGYFRSAIKTSFLYRETHLGIHCFPILFFSFPLPAALKAIENLRRSLSSYLIKFIEFLPLNIRSFRRRINFLQYAIYEFPRRMNAIHFANQIKNDERIFFLSMFCLFQFVEMPISILFLRRGES